MDNFVTYMTKYQNYTDKEFRKKSNTSYEIIYNHKNSEN